MFGYKTRGPKSSSLKNFKGLFSFSSKAYVIALEKSNAILSKIFWSLRSVKASIILLKTNTKKVKENKKKERKDIAELRKENVKVCPIFSEELSVRILFGNFYFDIMSNSQKMC